jgi:hypothetical protein
MGGDRIFSSGDRVWKEAEIQRITAFFLRRVAVSN